MNVVQICNLALSRLGAHRIQSLDEQTKEAVECSALYDFARQSTLESHDWGFARKHLILANLSESYTNWEYAYAWPTDCLAPRKILDPTGTSTGNAYDREANCYTQVGKVEFTHLTTNDLNSRVILSNKENAELAYTADIQDANIFSPLFIEALSYKLAADLAMPLRGKPELQVGFIQQYMAILNSASASSAQQEEIKPNNVNTLLNSRG